MEWKYLRIFRNLTAPDPAITDHVVPITGDAEDAELETKIAKKLEENYGHKAV